MRRQYPRYRNSGVEWLGEVPEHWEVQRLKNAASINDQTLSDNEDPLRKVSYVDIGSVHSTDGITMMEKMVFEDAPSRARRLVSDGDTIISTVRTYLRAITPIERPPDDMVVSTGFAVVRPRNLDSRFCSWVLKEYGFVEEVVACSTGVSYPAINAPKLGTFPIPIPPLDDQRAIAAFLDRETERIDKLVAKHRLLIERLAEYRTALITSTVTQGLPHDVARAAGFDPLPRFEPSGTEWLGDVPAHWDVLQLRHLGEAIIGLTYSPQDVVSEERGVLVLRASNVVDDHIVYGDNVYVDCAVPERLIVRQGDILICSRSGSRALIGKNARIDAESAGATFGAFMTVFRGENSEYLHYVFNSKLFENQSGAYSTSTINQLTLEILNSIKVPWPPLGEQRAIAAFLGRARARIDSLSGRVETAIERLQEYRTSLITAAVTGKIDVREPVYEEAVQE